MYLANNRYRDSGSQQTQSIIVNADRYSILINELMEIKNLAMSKIGEIQRKIGSENYEKIKIINSEYFKEIDGQEMYSITNANKYWEIKVSVIVNSSKASFCENIKKVTKLKYYSNLFKKSLYDINYPSNPQYNIEHKDYYYKGYDSKLSLKDEYPAIKDVLDKFYSKNNLIVSCMRNIEHSFNEYKLNCLNLKDGDDFVQHIKNFEVDVDSHLKTCEIELKGGTI
jgi:hypothetical protein